MRIVPVIDLMKGLVVRGVGGRRDEYCPVESLLAATPRPCDIATAFARQGFSDIYIADLDAIGGAGPAESQYDEIAKTGLNLWIDAGLSDLTRAARLADLKPAGRPIAGIIAGLESLPDFDLLAELLAHIGSDRFIFSLDLKGGQPLTHRTDWQALSPATIASRAMELGVRRMIVLDLAQVGMNAGVAATDLCRELRNRDATLEIISGGGVRNEGDLEQLATAGCDAALVASALHDGRLQPAPVFQAKR